MIMVGLLPFLFHIDHYPREEQTCAGSRSWVRIGNLASQLHVTELLEVVVAAVAVAATVDDFNVRHLVEK